MKGEEEVVVAFPKLLPRLHVLEVVWRGARGCLYDGDGGVKGMRKAQNGVGEGKGKEKARQEDDEGLEKEQETS